MSGEREPSSDGIFGGSSRTKRTRTCCNSMNAHMGGDGRRQRDAAAGVAALSDE